MTPTVTATPTATATVPPSGVLNDDIGGATLVGPLPYNTAQDTSAATSAADDPNMGSGNGANAHTVWYRFEPSTTMQIRVSTAGSDYDTILAIFTGARGSLTFVAGNDDDTTGGLSSEVTFDAQPGVVYHLEIAAFVGAGSSGTGGRLLLSVALAPHPTAVPTDAPIPPTWTPLPSATPTGPAPSNDDIVLALFIGALPYTVEQDTAGATMASDDPNMGDGTGVNGHTVWFRLETGTSGTVRVDTSGSDYDTVLAAFTGSRGNLSLVASNDDVSGTQQSEIAFSLQSGVVYYLEVASYGGWPAGQLRLRAQFTGVITVQTSVPTPTATPFGTPGLPGPTPFGGPFFPGLAPEPPGAMAPSSGSAGSLAGPGRAAYFAETGFGVATFTTWDYFQKRGGVRTFGYPISQEFMLFGFPVQFFQRALLQRLPDGSVARMNLLDEGLMPYTRINFSTFPAPDLELIHGAPSDSDPDYAEKAIAFIGANVPDEWEGLPVNFLSTFMSMVRSEDAFPLGDEAPDLLPLLNLELWGLPTSRPAFDPNNHGFVYQRFQRGILHFDALSGATEGLLLADHLKSIVTGQNLPPDLAEQAQGSPFYLQYDPTVPGGLARPEELPGSDMVGAFLPE